MRVGSVAEVRRYPVKSLVGEAVTACGVDGRGLVGDRHWAVTDPDGKLGSGKSTRRFRRMPGLLELASSYDDAMVPLVRFPDGRQLSGDDPRIHERLSEHVGRPVTLRAEDGVSHLDEGPVHLVTTASLAALEAHHGRPVDPARLRPNVVVEVPSGPGLVEDGWVGRELAVGPDLVLRVRGPMTRCVMVGLPQRGLAADRGLLASVQALNELRLGVVADVVRPGVVTVGDRVGLLG